MFSTVLLALTLASVGVPSPAPSAEPVLKFATTPLSKQAEAGRELYGLRCASCHGVDLAGSQDAPPLLQVGAANVDWWVSTGRMPASSDR